jgi:hypothetical protein
MRWFMHVQQTREISMIKTMSALMASMALVGFAGVAQAQGKLGDVTTSTDPAKAAAVEQQAAALKAERRHEAWHGSKHATHHDMKRVSSNARSSVKAATKS